MMPRIIGETVPTRMSFTFTPQNRKDVQTAMTEKKFSTVAECINAALRYYFENKDKPSMKSQFDAWMVSEEGSEYLSKIFDDKNQKLINEIQELRSLVMVRNDIKKLKESLKKE